MTTDAQGIVELRPCPFCGEKRKELRWHGDPGVLPVGAIVTVLAQDFGWPDAEAVPASVPCWVRWWPEGRDYPAYRSCDSGDLIAAPALEQGGEKP